MRSHRRHARKRQIEAAPARFGTASAARHHVLVVLAGERQQATGRDRAQHHGAHDRAGLAGQRIEVEHVVLATVLAQQLQQRVRFDATVAERHALGRGQGARTRGNHQRALRIDQAQRDQSRGLQQFGTHQRVERARHRHEAEHRPASAGRCLRLRAELEVVGGRAGALRHAGDRRALRRMAGTDGHVDQPLRQHAAALAAQRANQQGERAARVHRHAGTSTRRTAPRMPAINRSYQRGWVTTSAR